MSDLFAGIGSLIVVILILGTYMLPTIIVSVRQHRQAAPIFIVNLFLGWTLIGWVIALAWSVSA